MENISLDQIDGKIQIVMTQTDYTEIKAREKLAEFKLDEIAVIRDYFGITEIKKQSKISSVNQEIYKQLRGHLDGAMKNYRERVDKDENHL
jgi:hypothetical protein